MLAAFIPLVLCSAAAITTPTAAPPSSDLLRRVAHACHFSSFGQTVQTRNTQMHVDGIRSDEPLFIKSVIGAEPTAADASVLVATQEIETTPYTLRSDPASCRRVEARQRRFEAKLISKNSHETLLGLRVGETVEVECQEREIQVCAPGDR